MSRCEAEWQGSAWRSADGPLGAVCSSWMRILSSFRVGEKWRCQGETALSTETLPPWLPIEESRSLAHSALLVAWYVIHANPAVARVLLGMSASGVAAFRELGVGDLAQVARCHPDCVRPRWPTRLDVWAQLIEEAGRAEPRESRSATLRCLEASAGDLKWLSAYVEPSA